MRKLEEVEILEERVKKVYKGVEIGFGRFCVRYVYIGFVVKGFDIGNYVEELVWLKEVGIFKGEIFFLVMGERVEMEEDFLIFNWEKFVKVEFEEFYVREFEIEGIWFVFLEEI